MYIIGGFGGVRGAGAPLGVGEVVIITNRMSSGALIAPGGVSPPGESPRYIYASNIIQR